ATVSRRLSGHLTELTLHPLLDVMIGLLGDADITEQLEAVRRTGVHMELRGDTGLSEPQRVLDVLVAKAVGAADTDEGRRKPAEIVRPSGRSRVGNVGIQPGEVCAPTEGVGLPAPDHEVVVLARGRDLA